MILMRRRIVQTLLVKELRRLAANRGALVLLALLGAVAGLSRFLDAAPPILVSSAQGCFVDYWHEDAWVRHLKAHVPAPLQGRVHFRALEDLPQRDETLVYPQGHGAIQLRTVRAQDRDGVLVWIWYPGTDPTALAVFESWFWQESLNFRQAGGAVPSFLPVQRSSLIGSADFALSIATGLLLFAVFLLNVYLMPSLQAEEYEKGLLLAQMLTAASFVEILTARFVGYFSGSLVLGGALAALLRPDALATPFCWLALVVASAGAWGLGLTIASLARSQRAASLGALTYLLAVTCLLLLLRQIGVPEASRLFIEFHAPRLLHAALNESVQPGDWHSLLTAAALALAWCGLGTALFRSRGWR